MTETTETTEAPVQPEVLKIAVELVKPGGVFRATIGNKEIWRVKDGKDKYKDLELIPENRHRIAEYRGSSVINGTVNLSTNDPHTAHDVFPEYFGKPTGPRPQAQPKDNRPPQKPTAAVKKPYKPNRN